MRALVVDDSRAMRLILARVLRERGCDVVEAGDGQEALLALAAGDLPDVALVDWNMKSAPAISTLVPATSTRVRRLRRTTTPASCSRRTSVSGSS